MRLGLLLLCTLFVAPPAQAAVRGGSATDPAEGGGADLARAEVRYDDATGALELIVVLHAAPTGDAPTVSWLLAAGRAPSGACDLGRELLGVEATLASGEAVIRLPDDRRVPARVDVAGTTTRITARDAALAGLAVGCAQLLSATGDEVPAFDLAPGGPAPTTTGADGQGGSGTGSTGGSGGSGGSGTGATSDAGAYRVGKAVIRTRRLARRRVEVSARTTICGPLGLIEGKARYRLARGTSLTKPRDVSFARVQRRRCQQHRLVWHVKVASAARYEVRAALSATSLRLR